MPTIQQPRRAPEFVNGKQNTVLAVAPAQLFAVSWVDGNGQKSMALVLQFGKDNEDGGPGIFVLADENEMSTQLKIPNATIKKGVRAHLARQQDPNPEDVPESATSLVAAPGPKARPAAPAPKVEEVDIGEMEGPPSTGDVDITKLDIG